MKKIVIFILFSFLLLGLNYLGWLDWLKDEMSLIMGWRSGLYSSLTAGGEKTDTLDKQLAGCLADLAELKDENRQARRLLGAETKPETNFDLAKIISVGRDQAIVSLEYPDLIEVSASVVSGPFYLGKIAEIFGKTAKVNLLISPQTKLPVKIWPDQTTSAGESEIIGEGILVSENKNLYVEEILDKQKVAVGNWVGVIVESGDIFWIGKISQVFPSEDKIFQKVKIDWAVDLSPMVTVGVIKNSK